MEKHVADEDPLVRGGKAALGALVYLLAGVHLADVVVELHRVERGKGAEAALELLAPRVALFLVLAKDVLVGTDEVAVLAVEGVVGFAVRLHGLRGREEQGAGIVLAFHSFPAMHLPDVPQEVLAVLCAVAAICLEAPQLLVLCFVALQVFLQGLAELERLLAHGAGVDVRVEVGNVLVHAGHVPVEGVLLHRAVVAKRAPVGLLASLTHHVDLQLALAGEELLTVRALQPGVREVQVKVFHQVSPFLEAPLALRAHVGLEQVSGVL